MHLLAHLWLAQLSLMLRLLSELVQSFLLLRLFLHDLRILEVRLNLAHVFCEILGGVLRSKVPSSFVLHLFQQSLLCGVTPHSGALSQC